MLSQKSTISIIILSLLSFSLCLFLGIYRPATGIEQTEILWDTWGVPHIYGKDSESLFKAMGWAQGNSHGNLILQLYGQARGRAAEYWGEKYVKSDKYVRTMAIPKRAGEWYGAQSPIMRDYLDAFASGINDYAQENPDKIEDRVKVVLPVNGVDVLGHIQRVIHFNFLINPQKVEALASQKSFVKLSRNSQSVGAKHSGDNLSALPQILHPNASPLPKDNVTLQTGSNAWAIAPKHTTSGNAMLLANPHLPWSDLYLWYEAQLTAPGIDAYGVALVGMPVFAIAFNNNLGWTFTVNTIDGWDSYSLTLADGGYLWDGNVRPFETETQTLKVKQADGTLREEKLIIKRSIHGPVVGENKGKAIALRVVGLDKSQIMAQFWDMARARNLQEFETAIKPLQLPMFTIMYADREGNILHLFNGDIPIRSQGNWQYWQGIIPGDNSSTLWTKYHPYQDLPRLLNPPSGWLQNANDPPWTTTFPQVLNPDDYPAYMAPKFMGFRAQRSVRMLMEKPKISYEEMIADKFSSRMELAERILDELIAAARKSGSKLAMEAADVLAAWDREANADSRGTVLFGIWAISMPNSNWFTTPWNAKSPLTTPDGLANPDAAVKLLEGAANTVKLIYGSLDIPWGEVVRLRYGKVDLPASGAPGMWGSFRVIDLAPTNDGRFQSFGGDSYIAAIEFSNPVKAKVLNVYGNATQPGSPHIGDQLVLYSKNQLRPVWRSRQEIEDNLAGRKVF
ncbi:MAG TPA: acylase [Cyanobacteria bacterium UBA11149]|nr:acylase [Cyanobacteria bacterium UBA11367]HBE56355.1 acylase [Cyanobacteria bacterium UBA11366]HBK64225.1 acylase [Cyanobacteria bacterium UBA11166]HBR72782.1 acylase [Cyanobacteria bacterium UBA11159]HBS69887.1 acylase [Cyanobacteria bacterium UBA11153]HBW91798.1 acylase [Cyanobacteria bacterium UBA11149]HCA93774.1 acylase [Cyanobacteria bacterium UBA9226]